METTLVELDALVAATFELWDQEWVGFSWSRYFINHTRRVRALALRLAAEAGADGEIVALAATLHDITKRYDGEILRDDNGNRRVGADGLWRNEFLPPRGTNRVTRWVAERGLQGALHSDSGAIVAEALLDEAGFPTSLTTAVGACIRDHVRMKGHEGSNSSLEADVLYDADTLDANMGLVAFYRNIMIHCYRTFCRDGRVDLARYISYIPSWLEMKEPFIEQMTTVPGRRWARDRQARNVSTTRDLEREIATTSPLPGDGMLSAVAYLIAQVEHPDLERDRIALRQRWLPERRHLRQAVAFCDDLDAEVAGDK